MATIFSKIIAGEIPGRFVHRDDEVVAFLDIQPLTRGHVLVVPVQEVDHWTDLPAALRDRIFEVAQAVGEVQKAAFDAPRAGVLVQGFEVPHAHVHVFPAYSPADFELSNKMDGLSAEELDADAEKIREGLARLGRV